MKCRDERLSERKKVSIEMLLSVVQLCFNVIQCDTVELVYIIETAHFS